MNCRKLIAALLTVLLLVSGCSSKMSIEKIDKQAEQLLGENKYEELISLYEEAWNGGADKEALKTRIQDGYQAYANYLIANDGSPMDILHKYDELGKRFPDLAEYSQAMLASVAEYTMNELSEGDTLNLTALYQQITKEFEDNEPLCTYMQNAYETSLRNIITNDLNALIDAGLTTNLTSNQFEKTFEVIRQSNIFYDLLFCEGLEGMPIAVPHGQYIVSADIMDTFPEIYYGEYTGENIRNGLGYHVVYTESGEQYIKDITYAEFENNMVNGNFVEVALLNFGNPVSYTLSGQMKDNKYDGTCKLQAAANGSILNFELTFDDGYLVPLESGEDENGKYYVAATSSDGGSVTGIRYDQSMMDMQHGLFPSYMFPY
ncbi:MAG: hypothetical protein IIY25_04970 [Erysipelotrichaceae bacterium]|nr:hypothetical protein [Erysipelotrichaceae bacterium]